MSHDYSDIKNLFDFNIEMVINNYVNDVYQNNDAAKHIDENVDVSNIISIDLNKIYLKFIDILINEITISSGKEYSSGQIGYDIAKNLKEISYDEIDVSQHFGSKKVVFKFKTDLVRSSMANGQKTKSGTVLQYDDIDDIAELLNQGYEASNFVYGEWHEKKTKSIKDRHGAFFLQNAVCEFKKYLKDEYGSFVNVISAYYNDIDLEEY